MPATPAAPRPPSRPRRARHATGQGKKKAREAPAKKWDVDNHTSSGSLTHLAGNLSNKPAARSDHTAQPETEPAFNRFALKPLALGQPVHGAFAHQGVLELGDRAEDLEEHPTHGGGGVDTLVEHHQVHAVLLQAPTFRPGLRPEGMAPSGQFA